MEQRKKGYYKVKQYNHNPVIWYWNGDSFETFRSQPQVDEVESCDLLPPITHEDNQH